MVSPKAAIIQLLSSLLIVNTTAQSNSTSKRGIAYLGTSTPQDYNLFTTKSSPLKWYYNWSPYPVSNPRSFRNLEFVPLIPNLDSIQNNIVQLSTLLSTSTHLLTFNEPDAAISGGGSNISPSDAAAAYIHNINPLSVSNGGKFLISHPSTTGTLSGLNWLKSFNASCYALNATHGCITDFVATHFYGDFPALASWLGTLNGYYNADRSTSLQIWITELALPQQSAQATEVMMNTTLPYLDALSYVQRYAWFGLTRTANSNGWTGPGVALLDNSGDLSELGATYMGSGYSVGMSADSGSGAEGGAVGNTKGGLGLMMIVILVNLVMILVL